MGSRKWEVEKSHWLAFGKWILGSGKWILGSGRWILEVGSEFQKGDCEVDFGQ